MSDPKDAEKALREALCGIHGTELDDVGVCIPCHFDMPSLSCVVFEEEDGSRCQTHLTEFDHGGTCPKGGDEALSSFPK